MAFFKVHTLQLLVLYSISLVSAQCYYPNGTQVPGDEYAACDATAGAVSMCCALFRDSTDKDTCLPSGLCYNPYNASGFNEGTVGGTHWRESCSDPTWESPFCLKGICTNSSQPGGNFNNDVAMTQCSTDGKWCCGQDVDNATCCAADTIRYEIAATIGVSSSTSTSTSSTATSSSTSKISSSTPTASLSISKPASSNTGGKISLGVGVSAGAIVVATIIAFVVLHTRNQREASGNKEPFRDEGMEGSANNLAGFKAKLDTSHPRVMPRSELETGYPEVLPRIELETGQREIFELPGSSSAVELPGSEHETRETA